VHCNNLYNREKRNSYDQINQTTTTLDRHLHNQAKREIHINSNNITLDIRSKSYGLIHMLLRCKADLLQHSLMTKSR
jgi:hypothetical protein